MAGSVANPRIWINADVYVAPLATAPPADVTTAWAVAWLPLGLLSEDGATEKRDQDSNDFYAWGGILVRTVRSKFKRSIHITALEDNKTVWALVNPGSTSSTVTTLTTRVVKVPGMDIRAFGLQISDGIITQRRIIPRGEVVEIGEVKLSDSDMVAYDLSINIYPDSSGVLYTDLTNDPQAIVP